MVFLRSIGGISRFIFCLPRSLNSRRMRYGLFSLINLTGSRQKSAEVRSTFLLYVSSLDVSSLEFAFYYLLWTPVRADWVIIFAASSTSISFLLFSRVLRPDWCILLSGLLIEDFVESLVGERRVPGLRPCAIRFDRFLLASDVCCISAA